ncbi:Aste57867_2029 [Aphanomyces stellatus]|uniref:Aste57867_2029 protein n=1 Tax=Aphanomyces stellatus TaxID=120398 RepID=A0A485K817_9STRA|nr:hypothetical protein As57867_002026 [Aphanomyces stellatus]VFT79233.1 Aste57867_2029 [Aphanomyces stellatus]
MTLFDWDSLPSAYPEARSDARPVSQARRELDAKRTLDLRLAKLDPNYADDLFLPAPPKARPLARIQYDSAQGSTLGSNPIRLVYHHGHGPLHHRLRQPFISAAIWHKLGSPPLTTPKSSFCSANKSRLEMDYPFWVMSTALTDCILGLDLLRYLLSFKGADQIISLALLPQPAQQELPAGLATIKYTTVIPAQSVERIACSVSTSLPVSTTILVERIKRAPVQTAAALYQVNKHRSFLVEVINSTHEPITIPEATPLSSWLALDSFAERRVQVPPTSGSASVSFSS